MICGRFGRDLLIGPLNHIWIRILRRCRGWTLITEMHVVGEHLIVCRLNIVDVGEVGRVASWLGCLRLELIMVIELVSPCPLHPITQVRVCHWRILSTHGVWLAVLLL